MEFKIDSIRVQTALGESVTLSSAFHDRPGKGGVVVARALGEAKRFPGDRNNPNIGRDLAVGRALVKLGNHLIARALKASEQA